jgi:hypothetical protein
MTASVTTVICPRCHSRLDLTPPGGWCLGCDLPVLLGRADGIYLLAWCSHCKRDHQHGRHSHATECQWDPRRPHKHPCTCPPGTGDGHRWAHCGSDTSPYAETGYIVIEYPASPKEANTG